MLYQGEDAIRVEIAYRQEAVQRFAAAQHLAVIARCCQAGAGLPSLVRQLASRLRPSRTATPACCTV